MPPRNRAYIRIFSFVTCWVHVSAFAVNPAVPAAPPGLAPVPMANGLNVNPQTNRARGKQLLCEKGGLGERVKDYAAGAESKVLVERTKFIDNNTISISQHLNAQHVQAGMTVQNLRKTLISKIFNAVAAICEAQSRAVHDAANIEAAVRARSGANQCPKEAIDTYEAAAKSGNEVLEQTQRFKAELLQSYQSTLLYNKKALETPQARAELKPALQKEVRDLFGDLTPAASGKPPTEFEHVLDNGFAGKAFSQILAQRKQAESRRAALRTHAKSLAPVLEKCGSLNAGSFLAKDAKVADDPAGGRTPAAAVGGRNGQQSTVTQGDPNAGSGQDGTGRNRPPGSTSGGGLGGDGTGGGGGDGGLGPQGGATTQPTGLESMGTSVTHFLSDNWMLLAGAAALGTGGYLWYRHEKEQEKDKELEYTTNYLIAQQIVQKNAVPVTVSKVSTSTEVVNKTIVRRGLPGQPLDQTDTSTSTSTVTLTQSSYTTQTSVSTSSVVNTSSSTRTSTSTSTSSTTSTSTGTSTGTSTSTSSSTATSTSHRF